MKPLVTNKTGTWMLLVGSDLTSVEVLYPSLLLLSSRSGGQDPCLHQSYNRNCVSQKRTDHTSRIFLEEETAFRF